MILHIPTGKLFLNRKEAKIYFGTSRYRKMEREKKEIILIDNHNFIATNGLYYGKQGFASYTPE